MVIQNYRNVQSLKNIKKISFYLEEKISSYNLYYICYYFTLSIFNNCLKMYRLQYIYFA